VTARRIATGVELERLPHDERLDDVSFELLHHDDDADDDERGEEAPAHERDHGCREASDGGSGERYERAEECKNCERKPEGHAEQEEGEAAVPRR
jgi:hypothetical protein